MTQTNNERDALLKTQDFIERIIEHTTDDWAKTELREVFNFIELSLEKKPISQNEHQEAVAYAWEYESPDKTWKSITTNKTELQDHLEIGCTLVRELYTSPPKQIPDGWKPIETVPKDGTQVIIKCSGGRVATAFYDDKPFVGEGWHVVVPFLGGVGSGTDTFIYFPEDMPTHWMPLPSAPTNTEVGE